MCPFIHIFTPTNREHTVFFIHHSNHISLSEMKRDGEWEKKRERKYIKLIKYTLIFKYIQHDIYIFKEKDVWKSIHVLEFWYFCIWVVYFNLEIVCKYNDLNELFIFIKTVYRIFVRCSIKGIMKIELISLTWSLKCYL